jgi:hypothetical protein
MDKASLITRKLDLVANRFPISIILIACLAILFFAGTIFSYSLLEDELREYAARAFLFFSSGAIFSISAVLWLEDFVGYAKQQIITLLITLLWGIYCFFLEYTSETIYTGEIISFFAIYLAAILSVFFISFLKKDKDKAFWNFSVQTAFQLFLSVCFGIVIHTGLSIASIGIETLFNLNISKADIYLMIICYSLFTPIYFLANIPDKTTKHSEEITLSKYLKILIYILVSLAAIYAIILYIYLFKIIFAWELPKGYVSYLVSILAFSGLLIITLLYPARLEAKNKFAIFLPRYFGLIILPLLTLMTVGILRRINDYGITISRCYVVLLNIWLYGIYIYLFVVKAKRIKWIPISFAAIALLVSVGFWSIPNVTKHILTAELHGYLGGQKISFSKESFFNKMKIEDKQKIMDKAKYLRRTYGKESVKPFIADASVDKEIVSRRRDFVYYSYGDRSDNEIRHVGNFNTFIYMQYGTHVPNETFDCYSDGKQLIIKIIPDNRIFSIPLREGILNNSEQRDFKFPEKDIFQYEDYVILLYSIRGHYDKATDSVYIEYFMGDLFYNK